MMHGPEKSDSAIRARKLANKAASAAAERVEQRAGTEGGAADKAADLEGCKSRRRQLPGFGRQAYPLHGEVTTRDMRGRKSHGRPASQDARVGATGVASKPVGLNISE